MTEQRLVFVLYELHGLRGEDIARVIGCPPATVRGRLREARLVFSRDRPASEEERHERGGCRRGSRASAATRELVRRYLQRPHGGSEERAWSRFEAALLARPADGEPGRGARPRRWWALPRWRGFAAPAAPAAARPARWRPSSGRWPRAPAASTAASMATAPPIASPRPPQIIALGRSPRALEPGRWTIARKRRWSSPRERRPGRLSPRAPRRLRWHAGGSHSRWCRSRGRTLSPHRRSLRVHRARHDVRRGAGARPRRARGLRGTGRGVTVRPPAGGRVRRRHLVERHPRADGARQQGRRVYLRRCAAPGSNRPGSRARCPACARRPRVAGCGPRLPCSTSAASPRRISASQWPRLPSSRSSGGASPTAPCAPKATSASSSCWRPRDAREALDESAALLERGSSPERAAELRLLRGNLYRELGDLTRAEHEYRLAAELTAQAPAAPPRLEQTSGAVPGSN